MNKLGYKQKGIPMLKSPVKAVNPNLGNIGKVGFDKYGTKLKNPERTLSSEPAPVSDFDKYGTQTRASLRSKGPRVKDKNIPNPTATEMAPKQIYRGPTQEEGKKLTKAITSIVKDPAKGSGGSTRKKVNSVNAGIKTQKINVLDSGSARTSQIPTPGKAEKKDILNSNASKATASRIGKSRKDIRKEKRANIKGGMSRQEARLKKTQSKAASAKAKTNKTIKSIDPTKAKSADTGAKQTSARTTRAKAKRLEKRAERLKGRVNASKVSK